MGRTMLTFAETVAESFHSEVRLTWNLKSPTLAAATFTVRTVLVEVSFEQRDSGGPWHVGFDTVRGESSDRTNIALAFRIFYGLFQAVREFVEVREPEVMVLVSKDEDLRGIYGTYLRRERASVEGLGYRLEGPERVDPYGQFTLRRVRPPGWKQ